MTARLTLQSMKTTLLATLALVTTAFVALAADATGTWKADVPGRNGTTETTFVLKVEGGAVTGSIDAGRGAAPIAEGKVDGDTITFVQEFPGRDGGPARKITYTGKVSGDHIDFTRDTGRGTPAMFTAKKQ